MAFERIGEGTPYLEPESRHRVWLRFRNNTTCPVFVELAQPRRADGTYAPDLSDGEERRLNYYVADARVCSPNEHSTVAEALAAVLAIIALEPTAVATWQNVRNEPRRLIVRR